MNAAFDQMPNHARVWVYQSNRFLTESEQEIAARSLADFCNSWNAHGAMLKAAFDIRYGLFLILAVDENINAVSGCSIDKSVGLVKALGEQFGCDFFDRKLVSFRNAHDEIELQDINQFWALRKAGLADSETVVFNNLVQTVSEFRSGWEGPFAKSWHAELFT